jgi:hypothetical protein
MGCVVWGGEVIPTGSSEFPRNHEIVINHSATMFLPAPFLSVLVNQQNQTGDSHA